MSEIKWLTAGVLFVSLLQTHTATQLHFDTFQRMLTNPPPVAEALFTRWTAFKPMMFSSEKAAKEFARKVRKTVFRAIQAKKSFS